MWLSALSHAMKAGTEVPHSQRVRCRRISPKSANADFGEIGLHFQACQSNIDAALGQLRVFNAPTSSMTISLNADRVRITL